MVALEPANTKWRIEAQSASANLGIILFKSRRYPEASREFGKALRAAERLTSLDPADSQNQANRLTTLAWLADSRLAEGRLGEATNLRRRQLALLMNAPSSGEFNSVHRSQEVPARRALGRLLAAQGDLAGGLSQLQRAAAVGDRLLVIEPDNLDWVEIAAAAQLELGGILLASQRVGEAAGQVARGCANVDRLAASGNMLTDWRLLRVECFNKRARLALAAGRNGEALVASGQALAAAEAHQGADSADRRIAIASMRLLTGDILQRSGSQAAARAEWLAALSIWPQLSENPRQMAIRAELLTRVGRADEARPLAARLRNAGFRKLV
jgi:tetratricopeptide (TPR) repeat protein